MGRVGDLEIEQDVQYAEREWTAERVGWGLLLLVVALALAGLFGNGPLSWTTIKSSQGDLDVAYERFGRRGGSQELTVRTTADAARNGTWELFFSLDYLNALQVTSITPEPESVAADRGGVRFTFSQASPRADLEVTFAVTPTELLSQDGDISLPNGAELTLRQFFFP